MGKKRKKLKVETADADYEQFRANLEFIERQIETARHLQQRREVTRLKLKKLVMQLSFGAQQLERRRAESDAKAI